MKDGLRRAGTVVRGTDKKEKVKKVGGSLKPFEVYFQSSSSCCAIANFGDRSSMMCSIR